MRTLEEISGCRVTRRAGNAAMPPPVVPEGYARCAEGYVGGAAAVARAVETPLGLRSDPLAEVLRFSDFGAVFACVAASRATRRYRATLTEVAIRACDQSVSHLSYDLV